MQDNHIQISRFSILSNHLTSYSYIDASTVFQQHVVVNLVLKFTAYETYSISKN